MKVEATAARTRHTITVGDGTEIFFKDWGAGQPIVFSHGSPLNSDAWEEGHRVCTRERQIDSAVASAVAMTSPYRRSATSAAASADVMTGTTSKSTRSFHAASH
jgi:pimeloyl-ACP methyl ester carboxylesterase